MISILAHKLTPDQVAELGSEPKHIRDLDPGLAASIANCPADLSILRVMAVRLCSVALSEDAPPKILAGSGSPAFTAVLARKAHAFGVSLLFAHSERASVDEAQPDGSVKKTAYFRHLKFIEVW